MYGLLDYETFIVKYGDTPAGLLTLNHADRSVAYTAYDVRDARYWVPPTLQYRSLLQWVNEHIVERLP